MYDIAGIGLGPSNLSLACFLHGERDLNCIFLERSNDVTWHRGIQTRGSMMQTSHLKDLVSMEDPASPFSFLKFLQERGRLYLFAAKADKSISRLEFEQYLAWCASKLNSVNYSQAVHRVEFKAEGWFELATQTQIYAAKHISIGVGRVPYCGGINTIEDDRLFHSSDYLFNRERIERGNRVVVIGGGQSAADIVEDLLNNSDAGIEWITRRDSVYELDDSAFSNLWYTPAYHKHFFGCIASERERVIGSQRLSSDAISKHTIDNIYNMSYRRIIEGDYRFRIVPSSTVSDVVLGESGGSLTVRSRKSGSSAESATFADFVILATGYRRRSPPFLYELLESVKNGKDHHEMMDDFSIRIGGNKIYLLNSEEIVHGIAEKNLSLVAYRSRRVLNSLREIDTDGGDMTGSLVTW